MTEALQVLDQEHPLFAGVPVATPSQLLSLDLGDAPMPASVRARATALRPFAKTAKATMPNPSGLSTAHRVKARDLTMQAAFLGYTNRATLHYTQGPLRWEGIDRKDKAWKGQCPHHGDCSSFATWCIWNGLDHRHVRDLVNGLRWRAGYTGTQLVHGTRVFGIQRCDLLIYGRGWPGKHVAISVGGGMAISFGSEVGPLKVPIHYRPDLMQARRYI